MQGLGQGTSSPHRGLIKRTPTRSKASVPHDSASENILCPGIGRRGVTLAEMPVQALDHPRQGRETSSRHALRLHREIALVAISGGNCEGHLDPKRRLKGIGQPDLPRACARPHFDTPAPVRWDLRGNPYVLGRRTPRLPCWAEKGKTLTPRVILRPERLTDFFPGRWNVDQSMSPRSYRVAGIKLRGMAGAP